MLGITRETAKKIFAGKTDKNQCVAWARISDGLTTPIIQDGYNAAAIIRNSAGLYSFNFKTAMNNLNYVVSVLGGRPDNRVSTGMAYLSSADISIAGFTYQMVDQSFTTGVKPSIPLDTPDMYIIVFGGR